VRLRFGERSKGFTCNLVPLNSRFFVAIGVCAGVGGCRFFGVEGKGLLPSFPDAPGVCYGVGGGALIMSLSLEDYERGCGKTGIWALEIFAAVCVDRVVYLVSHLGVWEWAEGRQELNVTVRIWTRCIRSEEGNGVDNESTRREGECDALIS
jgi:hypothetical protein